MPVFYSRYSFRPAAKGFLVG